MTRFLRSPLAALVLLLASPGLAGVALDAAHPCPAIAPWLVQSVTGHHGDSGHHGSEAPDGEHECKCFGSCLNAPDIRPVNAATTLAVTPLVAAAVARPLHYALVPAGRPADRLPPATAPPLV